MGRESEKAAKGDIDATGGGYDQGRSSRVTNEEAFVYSPFHSFAPSLFRSPDDL